MTAIDRDDVETQASTWWGSVRGWWARHGLVARSAVIVLVLFALANVVLWGWFLAYVTVMEIRGPVAV